MDRAGNLYGTAATGPDRGVWKYPTWGSGTLLQVDTYRLRAGFRPHLPLSGPDGANPSARVSVRVRWRALRQAVQGGAHGRGVVFQLGPSPTFCHAVRCPWQRPLSVLRADKRRLESGSSDLVFDSAGNLYGTTGDGGDFLAEPCTSSCMPTVPGRDRAAQLPGGTSDGWGPQGGVIFDGQGNLYGTYGRRWQLEPALSTRSAIPDRGGRKA